MHRLFSHQPQFKRKGTLFASNYPFVSQVLRLSMHMNRSIPTKYDDILRELYQINMYQPMKLGLSNMERLYELLDRPLDSTPIVHITGTNGKGSVALKLASSLTSNHIRTGLFVSPHISSFRERMQIDGVAITEKEVEDMLPFILDLCLKNNISATFFEVTTALAFQFFQRKNCEALVLEVGLGGRLDATNVIPSPVLSIVTAIQKDHQKILGDTVEAIAEEKSGIIKKYSSVLLGPETPTHIFRKKGQTVGARCMYTLDDFFPTVNGDKPALNVSLSPRTNNNPYRQFNNSSTITGTWDYDDTDDLNTDIVRSALTILQKGESVLLPPVLWNISHSLTDRELQRFILKKSFFQERITSLEVSSALEKRPPCRFELFSLYHCGSNKQCRVVLDIAHNTAAMSALTKRISRVLLDKNVFDEVQRRRISSPQACPSSNANRPHPKVRVVVGMSADKDVSDCLSMVLGMVDGDLTRIYCTQADHPRAMSYQEIRKQLMDLKVKCAKNDKKDVDLAGRQPSETSMEWNSTHDGNVSTALCAAVRDSFSLSYELMTATHSSLSSVTREDVTSLPDVNVVELASPLFLSKEESSLPPDRWRLARDSLYSSIHPNTSGSPPKDVIVICGTAFMMAETRAILGIREPRDTTAFQATYSFSNKPIVN